MLFIFKQLAQDLIIAEDDPYFFLQFGEYVPKSQRKAEGEPAESEDVANFVASLVPTYLKVDTQGRVIRMDTFSMVHYFIPCLPYYQPPLVDDRPGCTPRLGYVQPALRGATGAHGRDINTVTVWIQPDARHWAYRAVDLRRLRSLATWPALAVQPPARLSRR